jgi:hypothetical protein
MTLRFFKMPLIPPPPSFDQGERAGDHEAFTQALHKDGQRVLIALDVKF